MVVFREVCVRSVAKKITACFSLSGSNTEHPHRLAIGERTQNLKKKHAIDDLDKIE
jgi:hypothetical protein